MRFKPSETSGYLFASEAKPATNAGDDKNSKPEASPILEASTEEPPVVPSAQSLLGLEQIQIALPEQSCTIVCPGHVLQACGASAHRIEISMARLTTTLGVDEHNVQAIFGEISLTVYLPPYSRTAVLEQYTFGANAVKLDRSRNFVQDLEPGTTITAANAAMDRIDSYPLEYGKLVNVLVSGIAYACSCSLNRGDPVECLLVGLAAGLGQFMRKLVMTRKFNHFAVWLIADFAGVTLCIIFATLLELILHQCMSISDLSALPIWLCGDFIGLRSGIISTVLFLVPDFPLIIPMLDLVRMDLSTGIPRFVYVLIPVISAEVAVWLVSVVSGWTVDLPAQPPIYGVRLSIIRAIYSSITSTGFAMLLNCTRWLSIYTGLICGVMNPLRFLTANNGMTRQLAAGLEALAIGLLADVTSRMASPRYSRISLSALAAVLMVPGMPLYAALIHLDSGGYS